jgi:uncharacterized protein DUF6916
MSVSRRRFLKSGAIGAVSAGLVLQSASTVLGGNSTEPGLSAPSAGRRLIFNYSRANFEPHVGSSFKVRLGENSVNLKLIDLVDYKASSKRQMSVTGTESFVLAFRAPKTISHHSATQKLEHPALGKFNLFMTGSKDRGRILYTAVINRIV